MTTKLRFYSFYFFWYHGYLPDHTRSWSFRRVVLLIDKWYIYIYMNCSIWCWSYTRRQSSTGFLRFFPQFQQHQQHRGGWNLEEGLQVRASRQPKASNFGWLYFEDPEHWLVCSRREVWWLHLPWHSRHEWRSHWWSSCVDPVEFGYHLLPFAQGQICFLVANQFRSLKTWTATGYHLTLFG